MLCNIVFLKATVTLSKPVCDFSDEIVLYLQIVIVILYGQLLFIPKLSACNSDFHCIRKIYVYVFLILVKYLFKCVPKLLNFVYPGIIFDSLETLTMLISLTRKAMITFISIIVSPKYTCKILEIF